MTTPEVNRLDEEGHAIGELGIVLEQAGDELHGHIAITPHMWVPGTEAVRISVLAACADVTMGLLSIPSMSPRVPVTLELDVHLFDHIEGTTTVHFKGHVAKAGSSVLVLRLELFDGDRRAGFGHAMFMAQPNPDLTIDGDISNLIVRFSDGECTLAAPFAERAGCVRTREGVAELPLTPDLLNASNTLNGAFLALAVEEAALSADPNGRPLESLQMRYARPVRTGPAIATATVQRGLGEVEVHDAATGALAVLATTRAEP